jgi:suppressor for copper-sensitivity B
MAVVVVLFACNLFGFYNFGLPRWAQGAMAPRPAPGGADSEPSLTGNFMTGAFATLLATPCSAPFLGTAIGFALARGPFEILSIFTALGLGLALPYLAIAAVPSLATRLPRPGPWMVTLRRVLGLFLVATAVWLLSVLSAQVGPGGAAAAAALLSALMLVIWMGRARIGRSRSTAIATPALASVLALAAVVLPSGFTWQEAGAVAVSQKDDGVWRSFDRAEVSRRVAEGGVVIVDVTADWCLTCQVNKKLVLDREPVSARLGEDGVTAMRRDWTLPSDEIAAYLAEHGRYGIPFNVVYGPGAPDGIVLPELLTSEAVMKALDKAAGG